MVRRFLPWPLPALLAWAAAWLAFLALQRAHLPAAWALVLACGLGTAASVLGGTWWQRGLIAAGFPLSLALTGAAGLPAWAWLLLAGGLAVLAWLVEGRKGAKAA